MSFGPICSKPGVADFQPDCQRRTEYKRAIALSIIPFGIRLQHGGLSRRVLLLGEAACRGDDQLFGAGRPLEDGVAPGCWTP